MVSCSEVIILEARILGNINSSIVLDELGNWNNALFISLHPLEEVISLQFGQNLDNCPLHPGSGHQRRVAWCCKSLFSDLYSLDCFHPVLDLVAQLSHELTLSTCTFVQSAIWKDQDITFLFKINLVQHLNRRMSGIKNKMEMIDIQIGQSIELSDLKEACE
jgi:hypothetical protein